jgi:hypothetical protein
MICVFFYVLLKVHLIIFILVINQINAQNVFYNKFISCLYMFRAPCAHPQEVKLYYTASGIIIPIGDARCKYEDYRVTWFIGTDV